jgi:uncharacterized membrane protein YkvA (DUF1232 family)
MVEDYREHFSEPSFWEKLAKFALKAGRQVVKIALILYYCLRDPETPARPKSVIVGALGYFVFPLDAIPDPTPVVGFADDLGALVLAMTIVAAHIKPEHRKKADEKLGEWFGDEPDADDNKHEPPPPELPGE